MEVFFGHELFGYDVLPWKRLFWQVESCLPPKERCSNVAANTLYVLEEEAVWNIGVLVEV